MCNDPRPWSAVAMVRYGFGLLPAVLMVVTVVLQSCYTLDARARDAG